MNKIKLDFKVDFMGVGAPKCGTEWIAQCLREHPQINFSKHKEINYFLSPTEGITNFVYTNIRIKNANEYRNQFENSSTKKKGEYNNHYIFDNQALAKVKDTFPEIKIIVALRDPVRYLHSIFWYMKFSNAYDLLPETLEKALDSKNKDDLFHIDHGKFGAFIENCYNIFDKENVKVVLLDEIKTDPEKTLSEIYQHIKVDTHFKPNCLYEHINATKAIRYPKLMRYVRYLIMLLEFAGLRNIINYLINTETPIKYFYKKIFHTNKIGYPKLEPETEKRLREYFKDDIAKLEKLISKDLSTWK